LEFRKICIVGPGAIGGMMAVMLARAGYNVSTLARQAKTDAINARGLTLLKGGETLHAQVKAATSATALGPQDLVVVTLKTNALTSVAPQLPALCGPNTPIVFAINGLPWWFFEGFGGRLAGSKINAADPGEVIARNVPSARSVWGVITCSVAERSDGVIEHTSRQRLVLGRANNDVSGLEEIAGVFRAGGYETPISTNIRKEIWEKLMINITLNPVSALTTATVGEMVAEPLLEEGMAGVAEEMIALAEALGLEVGAVPFNTMRQSTVKTSMLQDLERGRATEIDSIIEGAVEIAQQAGVPMPRTRMLLGLMRLRSKTAGLK